MALISNLHHWPVPNFVSYFLLVFDSLYLQTFITHQKVLFIRVRIEGPLSDLTDIWREIRIPGGAPAAGGRARPDVAVLAAAGLGGGRDAARAAHQVHLRHALQVHARAEVSSRSS